MIPNRSSVFATIVLISCAPGSAGAAEPKRAVPDPDPGAFSQSYLNPPELQFSCSGLIERKEEQLAELLEKGDPAERLAAARALWKGRSRRKATGVLKYLAGSPPGGEGFRAFQREVDAALRPEAILRELQKGDYLWGTWLAFLRPHKDLVPALLKGLKDKPEERSETMLALGNSGDPRALEPLVELLKSKDSPTIGFAAQALGYLGAAEAEPKLIELLGAEGVWVQARACNTLGKLGSRKALPALEKLAKDDRFTGAIDVKGAAAEAIRAIEKREKR